ncbi:unnamed protein product, partial [Brassica oleracea var. botrytis]
MVIINRVLCRSGGFKGNASHTFLTAYGLLCASFIFLHSVHLGKKKEGTHPLGNANVVAIQVTTRRHAVALYKKAKTMEKASEDSSKLLFGNW